MIYKIEKEIHTLMIVFEIPVSVVAEVLRTLIINLSKFRGNSENKI
jgi:hypothetical protein